MVYEAIQQRGRDELVRGGSSLFFSGLAAGLSMGFSQIIARIAMHGVGEPFGTVMLNGLFAGWPPGASSCTKADAGAVRPKIGRCAGTLPDG